MNTTTAIPTDPQEFEKFLERHDWYYEFSDDHRVYMRGIEAERHLNEFMKTATDEQKRIYNRQHRLRYDNGSFVTPTRPYVYPFPEVEKSTTYFTFGQTHVHSFMGKTLDKDVVVRITAHDPRAVMVQLFGDKWSMEYSEPQSPEIFPGGIVEITR